MTSANSRPQAETTVPSERELTEQEAARAVGGCGVWERQPSVSDSGPTRPVAISQDD